MKIVLIAWFAFGGHPTSSAITTDFSSIEACEAAGLALQEEGKQGKGANVKWRYICTAK